ncbi:phosphotransferase [Humibacter soli]
MELIAQGRTADVFDLSDGRVLRRYRSGRSAVDEARIMRHLETHGYPVPHVFDVDGGDLVLERVQGATLFELLANEPEQYERYGRLLGELHERLHRMPAPAWLAGGDDAGGEPDEHSSAVIVHRDLHPENVLLSDRGPVVIDWDNVAAGRASVDAAITVIVMLGAELDVDAVTAERVGPLRSLLVDAFLETCGTDPRDGLAEAIAYRRAIPNNTDAENRWLDEVAPDCLDAYFLQPRAR